MNISQRRCFFFLFCFVPEFRHKKQHWQKSSGFKADHSRLFTHVKIKTTLSKIFFELIVATMLNQMAII